MEIQRKHTYILGVKHDTYFMNYKSIAAA